MPAIEFGQELNLPKGESKYLKLRNKGDYIVFRIAGTPVYETDHWINREKVSCDKYNSLDNDAPCHYCDEYEAAVSADDKQAIRDLKPVTTFMYPILDRTSGKAGIYQFTAKSIHYGIDGYSKMGIDVFGCDWRVDRNKQTVDEAGPEFWSLKRLGEGVLSKEEKAELKRANEFELEGKQSESVVSDEVPIGVYKEGK